MTTVVGVLCSDGVVIGTDSSVTFGTGRFSTIEQCSEKLSVIADQVIVAGAGAVGSGQRFCAMVESAWQNEKFTGLDAISIAVNLSRSTIENFQATFMKPGGYGALMAFPAKNKAHLCEFGLADFQPELKTERLWYASMGSAQHITDPFLAFMREVFWQTGLPTVQDAIFAVTWTLEHAIAVNPGGVNGPARIATLECGQDTPVRVQSLSEEELDEHRQNIEAAKNLLRGFRAKHTETEIPDIPQP